MVSSLLDLGPQFLGELKAWFEKEGFAKKPINIPFLVGYPGDSTKFLRGDGTWTTASGVTYRKTTAKTVNTTTTATDLLNGEITVAANAIGASGLVRVTAFGDFLQNSGGLAAPPRIQVLLGATTVFDTGVSGQIGASATRFGWSFRMSLMNLGATNSQAAEMEFIDSNPTSTTTTDNTFTTGEGKYVSVGNGASAIQIAKGVNTSAVDTTASQVLAIKVINGSASATYETKLLGALVEII